MPYGDLSVGVSFNMNGSTPYSYSCGACSRCCEGKAIRVGPYEILRLARLVGLSTTDFIAAHTTSGGTILRLNEKGDCGFLSEKGCSVHIARPLACRLYPLGMLISPDSEYQFGNLAPHPQTKGTYGHDGTVNEYIEQQGALPFMEANAKYAKLYDHMVTVLTLIDPEASGDRQALRDEADELGDGTLISDWMDIDLIVPNITNLSFETAVEQHIEILTAKVNEIAGSQIDFV